MELAPVTLNILRFAAVVAIVGVIDFLFAVLAYSSAPHVELRGRPRHTAEAEHRTMSTGIGLAGGFNFCSAIVIASIGLSINLVIWMHR